MRAAKAAFLLYGVGLTQAASVATPWFCRLVVLIVAFVRSPAPLRVKSGVATFMAFMLVAVMFGGDLYDSRLLWLAGIAMLAHWPAPDVEAFLRGAFASRGKDIRVS